MEGGQRLKARSEDSRHNHGAAAGNWGGCSARAMTKRKKKSVFF